MTCRQERRKGKDYSLGERDRREHCQPKETDPTKEKKVRAGGSQSQQESIVSNSIDEKLTKNSQPRRRQDQRGKEPDEDVHNQTLNKQGEMDPTSDKMLKKHLTNQNSGTTCLGTTENCQKPMTCQKRRHGRPTTICEKKPWTDRTKVKENRQGVSQRRDCQMTHPTRRYLTGDTSKPANQGFWSPT